MFWYKGIDVLALSLLLLAGLIYLVKRIFYRRDNVDSTTVGDRITIISPFTFFAFHESSLGLKIVGFVLNMFFLAGTIVSLSISFVLLLNKGLSWDQVIAFSILLVVSFCSGMLNIGRILITDFRKSKGSGTGFMLYSMFLSTQLLTAYTILSGGLRIFYFLFVSIIFFYISFTLTNGIFGLKNK